MSDEDPPLVDQDDSSTRSSPVKYYLSFFNFSHTHTLPPHNIIKEKDQNYFFFTIQMYSTGMGTPPVFCVGRTQGSSRADTGDFFSDTGEFEGEFVLRGGVPGRSKQGVFLYERPQYIESY